MLDISDALMHGQSPMKQSHEVIRRDESIESIEHVLASNAFDRKKSFALVGFDKNGNVCVHASRQVKGFLDEQGMDSIFQEAYAKSVHDSFIIAEPTSAISIDDEQGSDYGDDEFPLISQTFGSGQVSRVYRRARQRANRAQSMLPSHASRHGAVESHLEPQRLQEVTPSDSGVGVPKLKKVGKRLQVDHTEEVRNFLKMRLKCMQQLAVKKIAKAWIKGICPKKQAKFPYQNKKGEEINGIKPRVPGWWPDTKVCRFIEPDHIRRDERMNLCLHLLRLRPSPAQLKEWNEEKAEPHPFQAKKGWTLFLKELAGESIFEELQKEDKKRTEFKKGQLWDMYEVAQMEEEYFNGERNHDDFHYYYEEDEEDQKMVPAKRPLPQASDFRGEQASRQSSESADERRTKRSRRNSVQDGKFLDISRPQPSDDDMVPDRSPEQVASTGALFNVESPRRASVPGSNATKRSTSNTRAKELCDAVPLKRDSSGDGHWQNFDPPQARWVDSNAKPNFQTPFHHFAMPNHCHAPPKLDQYQRYACAPPQEEPHMVQVHQVSHIPEPQFQTISSATMYNPGAMMAMPPNEYMAQECGVNVPSSQPFTNMAPTQYFLPADQGPSAEAFHGTVHQQYSNHHGLADRHIAPMSLHGLPFTQSSTWEGRPYNG